ncbi:hypothetical protein [Algoriphagus aquimarinus]|uniref:hypothetical protein n=1 Tax=Algoriphagus aquimarinus TaxID=237018 RepID=UPI0030DB42BD|tara:strand:- start:382310 stop:382891 length:582 start_codon:yes stop_codon:yes gene_type:complete
MKILPFLIIVLTSLNSFGQIPEFDSNVNESVEDQSYLFKKFYPEYEFILGYTQKSFWFKRQEYSVLTFNGTDWELKKWSYELKEEKPKKSKMKSRILVKEKVINLLNYFESKGFYSLNQDLLNWSKKDLGNGTMLHQSIMDGVFETFEFISSSGHRIYSAHEPVQKQEFVYIEQREIFLDCLDKFLDLIDETK